jgi:hypothetical protein
MNKRTLADILDIAERDTAQRLEGETRISNNKRRRSEREAAEKEPEFYVEEEADLEGQDDDDDDAPGVLPNMYEDLGDSVSLTFLK